MEPTPPDLFYIDYNILFEALVTIVVFSFIIERILAVVFESRIFINWAEETKEIKEIKQGDEVIVKGIKGKPKKQGIRELIAVLISVFFILWIKFDVISVILQSSQEATMPGMVITAFLIAGGSKASTSLFRDVLGFMSSAERERKINKEKKQ